MQMCQLIHQSPALHPRGLQKQICMLICSHPLVWAHGVCRLGFSSVCLCITDVCVALVYSLSLDICYAAIPKRKITQNGLTAVSLP
jgi:hypothetical protein